MQENEPQIRASFSSHSTHSQRNPPASTRRPTPSRTIRTRESSRKKFQAGSQCDLRRGKPPPPSRLARSSSAGYCNSKSMAKSSELTPAYEDGMRGLTSHFTDSLLKHAESYEAVEIRYIDNDKCTIVRPRPGDSCGQVVLRTSQYPISGWNRKPDGVVRKQKVCVEKVHIKNLLHTKRERCGNLSSSRSSEYVPSDEPPRSEATTAVTPPTEPATQGWPRNDRYFHHRIENLEIEPQLTTTRVGEKYTDVSGDWCRKLVSAPERRKLEGSSPAGSVSRSVYSRRASKDMLDYIKQKTMEASGEDACDDCENDNVKLGENEEDRNEVSEEVSADVSSFINLCGDPQAASVEDDKRRVYVGYGRDSPGLSSSDHREGKENHHSSSKLGKSLESDEISTEKSRVSQSSETVLESPGFNCSEQLTNRNSMGERRRKGYTVNTGIDMDLSQLNHYHVAPEANTTISMMPFPSPVVNPEYQVKTTRLADWSVSDTEQKKPATTFQLYNAHTGRSFPCLSDTGMNLNEPSTSISSSGGKIVDYGPTTHSAETQSTDWLPSEPAPKNSPYTLMPEETIAEYKQIALQILMERKQRAIDKSLAPKSLETSDRNVIKKRRTGKVSQKALKVDHRDSAAVEELPHSASRSSQKTSFWASSRIKNDIEKHRNRLRTSEGNKVLSCRLGSDSWLTQKLKTFEKHCANKEDGIAFQDRRADNLTEANPNIQRKKSFNKVESNQHAKRSEPHSKAQSKELVATVDVRTSDERTERIQRARFPNVKKCKKTAATHKTPRRPPNTIWHPGVCPEVVQFLNTVSLTEATRSEVLHTQLSMNADSLAPVKAAQGLSARATPTKNETRGTASFGIRKPAGDRKQSTAILECFPTEHHQLFPSINAVESRLRGSGIVPLREVVPLPSPKNATRDSETHLKFGVKSGSRPLLPRGFSSERGNSPPGNVDSTTKDIETAENTDGNKNEKREPHNRSYLEMFQNVLKSPTAKAAHALGTFLKNPEAVPEVNEENYMTVDEIINSYQKIVQQLSNVPSVVPRGNTSLKHQIKSSPEVDKTEFGGPRSQIRLQEERLSFHRSPLARVSPQAARYTKPMKSVVSKMKRGHIIPPGRRSKGINNSFSDSNASELPSESTNKKGIPRQTNKSKNTTSEVSAIQRSKVIHKTRSPLDRSNPRLDFIPSPGRKPMSTFSQSGKSNKTDARLKSSLADERNCKVSFDYSDSPSKATRSRDGQASVSLKSKVESPVGNTLLVSETPAKNRQQSSKTSPNSSGTPPRGSSLFCGSLIKKNPTKTRAIPGGTKLLTRDNRVDCSDFESMTQPTRSCAEPSCSKWQQPPVRTAAEDSNEEDCLLKLKESLWGLQSPEYLSGQQQQAWNRPCSGLLNVGTSPTGSNAPLQYSCSPISGTGQNLSSVSNQLLVHNECTSSIKAQALMASNTHTKLITAGHTQETLHGKARGNDINITPSGELGHRRSISTASLQFGAQLAQLEAYHKASSTLFSSGAIGISKTYPAITIFAPQACLNILSSSPADSRPEPDAPEASIKSPDVKQDKFSGLQPELPKRREIAEKCKSPVLDTDKKLRSEEAESVGSMALPRFDQKLQLKPICKSNSLQLMTSRDRYTRDVRPGTASVTEGVQKQVSKHRSISPNSRSLSGGSSLHKIANYEKQTTSSLLRNERTALHGLMLSSSTHQQRSSATKGAHVKQTKSLPQSSTAISHIATHRSNVGGIASLRMTDTSTPCRKKVLEHRPGKDQDYQKHTLKGQKSTPNISGFQSRAFNQASSPDRKSYPAWKETLVAVSKSSLSWSKQHLARSQDVKDKHHVSSVALKAFLDKPFSCLQRSSDEVKTVKKPTDSFNWRSQSTERLELGHHPGRHPPLACPSDQLSRQSGAKAQSRLGEACVLKGDGHVGTVKSCVVSASASVPDSVCFEPQPSAASKNRNQISPHNQRKQMTRSGACSTVEPDPLLNSTAHEKNMENQTILTSKSQLTEDESDLSDVSSLTAVRKNIVASTCRMILRESKNLLVSNLKKKENQDKLKVKSAATVGVDDQHVTSICQEVIDPSMISEAPYEIKKTASLQDRASHSGISIGGTTSFSTMISSVAVSMVRGPSSCLAGKSEDVDAQPLDTKHEVSRVNNTCIAMSSSDRLAGLANEQKILDCSLIGVPKTDDIVTVVSGTEPPLSVPFKQSKHLSMGKPKLQNEENRLNIDWWFNGSLSEKFPSGGDCDTPEAFELNAIPRSADKESHHMKENPRTSNVKQHQFSLHESQADIVDGVCRSSPLSGLELQTQLDQLYDSSDQMILRPDQSKCSPSSEISKQTNNAPRSQVGAESVRNNDVELFVELDHKLENSEKSMNIEIKLQSEGKISSVEDREVQKKMTNGCMKENAPIRCAVFELSRSEQFKDELKAEFKEWNKQLQGVAVDSSEETKVSNDKEGSVGNIRQPNVDLEDKLNETLTLCRNLFRGDSVNPDGSSCEALLVDKKDKLRDLHHKGGELNPRMEIDSIVEAKKDDQTLASHYKDIFNTFGAKLNPQLSGSLEDIGESKRQTDKCKDFQVVTESTGTEKGHKEEWPRTHTYFVNTDQDPPPGSKATPTEITADFDVSKDTATRFGFPETCRSTLIKERKLETLMVKSERSTQSFNVLGSDELDYSRKNFNPDQTALHEPLVTASHKQTRYEPSLLEPRGLPTSPRNMIRFDDEQNGIGGNVARNEASQSLTAENDRHLFGLTKPPLAQIGSLPVVIESSPAVDNLAYPDRPGNNEFGSLEDGEENCSQMPYHFSSVKNEILANQKQEPETSREPCPFKDKRIGSYPSVCCQDSHLFTARTEDSGIIQIPPGDHFQNSADLTALCQEETILPEMITQIQCEETSTVDNTNLKPVAIAGLGALAYLGTMGEREEVKMRTMWYERYLQAQQEMLELAPVRIQESVDSDEVRGVKNFVLVDDKLVESASAAPELTGDSKGTPLEIIEARRNKSMEDSDNEENWLRQESDKDTAHDPRQILIGNSTEHDIATLSTGPPVEGSSLDDSKVKITFGPLPAASVTSSAVTKDNHLEDADQPPLNSIPCYSTQLSGEPEGCDSARVGVAENEITLTSSQHVGSKQEYQADLLSLGTNVRRPSSSSETVTSRSTDFMCSSHSCSCCSLSSGHRSSWDSHSARRDPGLNQVCSKSELSSPDYGHLLLIPVLCTWSPQQKDGTPNIGGLQPATPAEVSCGSQVFEKDKLIHYQRGSESTPDSIRMCDGDSSRQADYFERNLEAKAEFGSLNKGEKCTGNPQLVSGVGIRSSAGRCVQESLHTPTELLPSAEENEDRFVQPQFSSTVKGTSEHGRKDSDNNDNLEKSVNDFSLFQSQHTLLADEQHEQNAGERIVESPTEIRLHLRHSSLSNGNRVTVQNLHQGIFETPGVYVSEQGQDQIDDNVSTQEEMTMEGCEESKNSRGLKVTNVLIRITSLPGEYLNRQHAPRKPVQTTVTNGRIGGRKSHERAPQQTFDLATYEETAEIKVNLGSVTNDRYTPTKGKGNARRKHNSHPETRISQKLRKKEKLETVSGMKNYLTTYTLLDSQKLQKGSTEDIDENCFTLEDFVPDKRSPRSRPRRNTLSSPECAQADPGSVCSPLVRMFPDSHRDDHRWICSSPKKSSRTKRCHEMSTQTLLKQTDFQDTSMSSLTKALKPKLHVTILRDSCTGTSETTLLLESTHILAGEAINSVHDAGICQGDIFNEVAQATSVKSSVALSSSADSSMSSGKHKNVNIEQKVYENLDMFLKSTRHNSTSVTETAASLSPPVNPFIQGLSSENDVSCFQKTTSPFYLTNLTTLKGDIECDLKCTSTIFEGVSPNLAPRPATKLTLNAHSFGKDANQQVTMRQVTTQSDDQDSRSCLTPFSEPMHDTWSQCTPRHRFENTDVGGRSFQNINTDTTDTAPQSQIYKTTEVCSGQYPCDPDRMKITGLLTSTSSQHCHPVPDKILSNKCGPWLELYDSASLQAKSNQETLQDVRPLPSEQDALPLQLERDISQQVNNLSVIQSLPLSSTLTGRQQLLTAFDDVKCGMWSEPLSERRAISAVSFTISSNQPQPTTSTNPFLCSAPAQLATTPATERSFLAAFDPLVSPLDEAQTADGSFGDDCSTKAASKDLKLCPTCCKDTLHRSLSPSEIDEFASFLSERLSNKYAETVNGIDLLNYCSGINAKSYHEEENLILFSDRSQTDDEQIFLTHNEPISSSPAWDLPKISSRQTLLKLESSKAAENKVAVDGEIRMSRKEVNLYDWPGQHSETVPREGIFGLPHCSKTVDYRKYSGQGMTTSYDVMNCCPFGFKGDDVMVSNDTAVVGVGSALWTPFNSTALESKSESRSKTASSRSLLIRKEAFDEKMEGEIAARYFARGMSDTDNFVTDSSSQERYLQKKNPAIRRFKNGQDCSSLPKDERSGTDQMLDAVTTLTSQFFHIVKGLKKRLRPSQKRRLRSKLRWARLFSRSRHNYSRLSYRSGIRHRRTEQRQSMAKKKTSSKPVQTTSNHSGHVLNKSPPSTYSLKSFRISSTKRLVTDAPCLKSSCTSTKEKLGLVSCSNMQLSPLFSSFSTEPTEGSSSSTQSYNKYKPLPPCSSTSASLRASSSCSSKDNKSYPEDTLELVRDSHTFSMLETSPIETAGEQDVPKNDPLNSQELPGVYEDWCGEENHGSADGYYQNYFFPSQAPVFVDVNSGVYGLSSLPFTLISALLGYMESDFDACQVEERRDTPKVLVLGEQDEKGAEFLEGTGHWSKALVRSYVKIQEIVELSSDNGNDDESICHLTTDLINYENVQPRAFPGEPEHADDIICNNQIEIYRGQIKNRSESVPSTNFVGGVRIRNVQFSSGTLISRQERVPFLKSSDAKPESTPTDYSFTKDLQVNKRMAKEARLHGHERGSTVVELQCSDQVFAERTFAQEASSGSDTDSSLLAREVDRHSMSRFTASHGNYFINDDMSSPPKRQKSERSGKLSTPFPRDSRRRNRDETKADSLCLIKDNLKNKAVKRCVHRDNGKRKKRSKFKSSPHKIDKKAVTNSCKGPESLGRAFVESILVSEWVPELRDKIERPTYSSLEVKETELDLGMLEDCEPDTYDELGSLCSEMPDSSSKLYRVDAPAANPCDTITGARMGTDTTGYRPDRQLHQCRTSVSTTAIRTTCQSRDFASCTPYMTWTEKSEGEVFTRVISPGQEEQNKGCIKLDPEETDDKLSNAEIFNFNLLFSRSAPVQRTCCTQTDWNNMGQNSLENRDVGEGRLNLAEIKKVMGRCIKSKHFKYYVEHIVDERVKDALHPTYQGGSATTKTVFHSDQTLSAMCTQEASQTILPAGSREGTSSKEVFSPKGTINFRDSRSIQESPRERVLPKLYLSQASSWNHSPRRNSGYKKSRQDLSWPQSSLGSHAGVSGLEASRHTTFVVSNSSAVPEVHTRVKASEADGSLPGVQLLATRTPASNHDSSDGDEEGFCSSPTGLEGARDHHKTVERFQDGASPCIIESPRILAQQTNEKQPFEKSKDRSQPSRKQTNEENHLMLEVMSEEAGRVFNQNEEEKRFEVLPSASRKTSEEHNAKLDNEDNSQIQVREVGEKNASGNGLPRDAGTQVNDEVGESVTPDVSSTSSMKIDYGRLKHVLSAETKTLWKNLTRLEQTCDRCKRCRKQYDSIMGTTKVKGDKLDVAVSLQTSYEVMWTPENVNNAQCSHSCKLSMHHHPSNETGTSHDNCTTSQKFKFQNDKDVASELLGSNTKHSERKKIQSAKMYQRSTTDSHHTSPTETKPLQMSSSVKAHISKFSTQTASPKPCEAGASARPNLIKRSNTAKIIEMFERRKSISQDDMECSDLRRSSQKQASVENNVLIRSDYDSSTSERCRSLTYRVSPKILVGVKKKDHSLNQNEAAIPLIPKFGSSSHKQMIEDVEKTKSVAHHKSASAKQSPESSCRNNIPSSADLSNAKQILAMNAPSSVTDEWIQILANILSEMQKTFPQISRTSSKVQDDPSASSSVSRSVEDALSLKATDRQPENCNRENDKSRHCNYKNLASKDVKKKSPTYDAVYHRGYHDREEERTWTVSNTSGDTDSGQQRAQAKEKFLDVKETNDRLFTMEAGDVGECEATDRDKNRENGAVGNGATALANMFNDDSRRTPERDVHSKDDTSCSLLPKTTEDLSQLSRSNTSKLADLSSFEDFMNENNQAIGSLTSGLVSSNRKTSDMHSIGVKTPPGVMKHLEVNHIAFQSQAARTLPNLSDCPPLATSSKNDLALIDSTDKSRRLQMSAEEVEHLVAKQLPRNQVNIMKKKSKPPSRSPLDTLDAYFRKSSSTSNLRTALVSRQKSYDELSHVNYSKFIKQPSESFILENRKYQGRNPTPIPGKSQNKALTCRKRSSDCDDSVSSLKPSEHKGTGAGVFKAEIVSEDDTCERMPDLPLESGELSFPLDKCRHDLPNESSAEAYRTDFGWQGDSVRVGWMSSSLTNAECRSDKFNAQVWQNEPRKCNRGEAYKMPDFEFMYSTSDPDEMHSVTRSFSCSRQPSCLAGQPISLSADDSRVLEPSPIPILSENLRCFEESLELTMGTMNDVKDLSFLSNDKEYYEEKSGSTNQQSLTRATLSAPEDHLKQSKVAILDVHNLNSGGAKVTESEQALSDHEEASEISFSLVRAVGQGKLWYDCTKFDEKRQKRSKLSRRHSGQEFHRTASRNQNCSSDSVSCPQEQNQTDLSLTVVSWPELVPHETKSSCTERTLARRNTWSTPEQGCTPKEKSNHYNISPLEVVQIPVDIYTVPAHKFASSQKKKKKKTDVPTRTVAISGPVRNMSIAVQRHPTPTADDMCQAGQSLPPGRRQHVAGETFANQLSQQALRPEEEDRKETEGSGQEERKGTTSWMHSVKKILPFGRRAV